MKLRRYLTIAGILVSALALPQQLQPVKTQVDQLMNTGEISGESEVPTNDFRTRQISLAAVFTLNSGPGSRPVPVLPCRCGVRNMTGSFRKEGRIYNGERARVNEFPWRVSISPVANPTKSLCSGSLISPQWVLTSASCLYYKSIEHILIVLGDHNLEQVDETDHILVSVSQKILHENYVPTLKNMMNFPSNPIEDYDIALLKLSEPIRSTGNVQPVCLPRHLTGKDLSGSPVITSGWGLKESGVDEETKELYKVTLTYYSNSVYRKVIGPKHFPEQIRLDLSDNLVFTFDTDKGIYPFDYGTTLEYLDINTGLYYTVGVADSIQFLENEKKFLGGWTDVMKFLPWIDANAKGAQFCSLEKD